MSFAPHLFRCTLRHLQCTVYDRIRAVPPPNIHNQSLSRFTHGLSGVGSVSATRLETHTRMGVVLCSSRIDLDEACIILCHARVRSAISYTRPSARYVQAHLHLLCLHVHFQPSMPHSLEVEIARPSVPPQVVPWTGRKTRRSQARHAQRTVSLRRRRACPVASSLCLA